MKKIKVDHSLLVETQAELVIFKSYSMGSVIATEDHLK